MPDRWAVAAGNWSNTATWNGGTLPGSGDDVFADGRAVTIDQDITVLSIRTTQRSGGTAGGNFQVSGTRAINANVIAGTTNCLSHAASAVSTITSNVTGGGSSNAVGVLISVAATCTIIGTCTGGSNSTAHAVNCTNASGVVTINGDLVGSTSRGFNQTGGSATINGNATNNNSCSVGGGTCTINLTSDITGTGTSGNVAVLGSGSCGISGGDLIGGASSNFFPLVVSGGRCEVTGNILASAGSDGCSHSAFGVLVVVGNVIGNGARNGIVSAAVGGLFIRGDLSSGAGTGDGVRCTALQGTNVVFGTVNGGTGGAANGISNTSGCDWFIFGSTVDSTGAAINNTGTGSVTVTAVGGGGASLPLIGPGGLVY
jgi:hypothetical protein